MSVCLTQRLILHSIFIKGCLVKMKQPFKKIKQPSVRAKGCLVFIKEVMR
ncbi:MAG: hypothetical protein LBL74_07910 [Bacteroidales bacterium]|nr:hypothetical protein [Bacteroidales bacterium]